MVITPGLGVELGLVRGLVTGRGGEVAIQGLTSQEGCSGLVVRNFGRSDSRGQRL